MANWKADFWKANVSQVIDRVYVGQISHSEAIAELMNLGLDDDDATEYANKAIRKLRNQRFLSKLWIVVALFGLAAIMVLFISSDYGAV